MRKDKLESVKRSISVNNEDDRKLPVIRTHSSDKYDRYLSDIFYLPGREDAEKVAVEGRFLNGELAEKSLAVVV